MLKRKYRFQDKSVFVKIKEEGKLLRGKFMMFKYIREGDETRFGVVISKKISKKAVRRNKIKRRIFESLRLFLKENNEGNEMLKGLNLIIFVNKIVVEASFKQIKEDVYKNLSILLK